MYGAHFLVIRTLKGIVSLYIVLRSRIELNINAKEVKIIMKGHLQLIAVLAICLILIPIASLLKAPQTKQADSDISDSVDILFLSSGKVETISMRDYIIGAVFAQMPADFEPEALRAQAVLAHTYALRRRLEEELSPDDELRGALISDDTEKYQAYFTEAQARVVYGEKYAECRKRIAAAADYAASRYLSFEGKPIISAFHAISCGKTESAKNVWGQAVPYLIGVDSSWDEDSSAFSSGRMISEDELVLALNAEFPDADLTGETPDIKITERTESGCVLTVELYGKVYISGAALARAVGLPSACFDITEAADEYRFICKGRGHLVGMSQHGANTMAGSGKSCEEILSHYFPNTTLQYTAAAK